MCGLAGFISPQPTVQAVGVFRLLWLLNAERGLDASGIVGINEKEHELKKKAIPIYEFIRHVGENDPIFEFPVIIGHTRNSTSGDPKADDHAHPFVFDNIIGAHNGILWGWEEINPKAPVDSMVIFELLTRTTPQEAFKEIYGANAISYYDTKEKYLGLARDGMPLAVAYSLELNTLFWSSESFHLYEALNFYQVESEDIVELDSNILYKFSIEGQEIIMEEEQAEFGYMPVYKPDSPIIKITSDNGESPNTLNALQRILACQYYYIAEDKINIVAQCEDCGSYHPQLPIWANSGMILCHECNEFSEINYGIKGEAITNRLGELLPQYYQYFEEVIFK